MEDFFETSISEIDGQMVAFFGVFDGIILFPHHSIASFRWRKFLLPTRFLSSALNIAPF